LLIFSGHPKAKGDDRISQMKPVSALNVKDLSVTSVACSDAATVVLTKKGEIYVLHEYQCRKIASKYVAFTVIFFNCYCWFLAMFLFNF